MNHLELMNEEMKHVFVNGMEASDAMSLDDVLHVVIYAIVAGNRNALLN